MDDLNTIAQWLLIIGFVVFCIMPVIMFAIVFWLVRRYLNGLSAPDITRITADYEALHAAHPNDSRDQLVDRMIRRQAFRCGVVGAITGFGGFVTLIIGMPIDILASMQMQATLVQFIATAYGHTSITNTEVRVRQALILSGGERVAQSTAQVLAGFAVRFVGKSLSKLIPFIGAIISFAVNYALARATGHLAQRWYSGQLRIKAPGSGLLDRG